MKIKFWGTRGALPSSFTAKQHREKIFDAIQASQGRSLKTPQAINEFINRQLPFALSQTYGSNTPCVEVESATEDAFVLLDAGTGIRDFAVNLVKIRPGPKEFHILLSHLHWDHIQGFPFFGPAYQSSNKVVIHSCHPETEKAFKTLMSEPFFPVAWNELEADIDFVIHNPEEPFQLLDFEVSMLEQNHHGKSFAYKLGNKEKSVVYSTDCEHKETYKNENYPFVPFFKNVDVVVFDAMSTYKEKAMRGWGHSNNKVGIELASRAKVKKLILFHHDRETDDKTLDQVLIDSLQCKDKLDSKFPNTIEIAYDGMELVV